MTIGISTILTVASCNQQQNQQPVGATIQPAPAGAALHPSSILTELQRFKKFHLTPKTKAIVVVADNSCLECNRRLSDTMSGYLKDKDIQFVISAKETAIDLTDYLNSSRQDIVFDKNHHLTDSEIVKGSTVFFMKGNKVDTAVQVDARQIDEQFAFIQNKIER